MFQKGRSDQNGRLWVKEKSLRAFLVRFLGFKCTWNLKTGPKMHKIILSAIFWPIFRLWFAINMIIPVLRPKCLYNAEVLLVLRIVYDHAGRRAHNIIVLVKLSRNVCSAAMLLYYATRIVQPSFGQIVLSWKAKLLAYLLLVRKLHKQKEDEGGKEIFLVNVIVALSARGKQHQCHLVVPGRRNLLR